MFGFELAKAFVTIQADASGLPKDLSQVKGMVVQQIGAIQSTAMRMMAMVGAGAGVTMFAKMGISAAAAAEQTRVAFEVMLGSAEETNQIMTDLVDFAALTPFEMPEIKQAARGLIQFGERGEELMESLNILGNAASGTSSSFGEIALIFNQVRGVGKLLTQDFRQLSTRGVISLQDIADYFGVATDAAQEMLSAGQVSFKDLREILKGMSSEGGRFANMMEKQSKTFSGAMSTIKDEFGILAKNVMTPFVKLLTKVITEYKAYIFNAVKFAIVAGSMAAAIKAVTIALRAYQVVTQASAAATAFLQALTGPAGWAKVAAGVAAAAAAIYVMNRSIEGTAAAASEAVEATVKLEQSIEGVVNASAGLDTVARRYNKLGREAKMLGSFARRFADSLEGDDFMNISFSDKVVAGWKEAAKQEGEVGELYKRIILTWQMLKERQEMVLNAESTYGKGGSLTASKKKYAAETAKDLAKHLRKLADNPSLGGATTSAFGSVEEADEEAARIVEAFKSPLEKHQVEVAKLDELWNLGKISAENYTKQLRILKDEYWEDRGTPYGAFDIFEKIGAKVAGFGKKAAGVAGAGSKKITDKLAETVGSPGVLVEGRVGFSDLGKQIQDSILRKERPEEKIAEEVERQTPILEATKLGILKLIEKAQGFGSLVADEAGL